MRVLARNEGKLIQLKEKYPEIEIYPGDISDPFVCKQACYGVNGILHLAGFKHVGLAERFTNENINTNREVFEMSFPNRVVLNESVRNLFYHVPMWFAMLALLGMSAWYAIKYLRFSQLSDDVMADSLIRVGILAGILGCITGATWARVTWQSWWPASDPKLNGVAIGMTMYIAYLLLRSTLSDPYQRARITSVYSVFIFPIFIALIVIMPKLSPNSLHPGSGGTVGFNKYDLDSTMRLFFYPAVIGWIALFYWIANLRLRIAHLTEKQLNE